MSNENLLLVIQLNINLNFFYVSLKKLHISINIINHLVIFI